MSLKTVLDHGVCQLGADYLTWVGFCPGNQDRFGLVEAANEGIVYFCVPESSRLPTGRCADAGGSGLRKHFAVPHPIPNPPHSPARKPGVLPTYHLHLHPVATFLSPCYSSEAAFHLLSLVVIFSIFGRAELLPCIPDKLRRSLSNYRKRYFQNAPCTRLASLHWHRRSWRLL